MGCFLGYYADDILLEDIVNGNKIIGKNNLKQFFDWENTDFKMLESTNLIVLDKIIEGDKAVLQGYFTKFRWANSGFEPMHFTSILTFDVLNKIIKQVDWINYPANLVDYENRKNSNSWIKKVN